MHRRSGVRRQREPLAIATPPSQTDPSPAQSTAGVQGRAGLSTVDSCQSTRRCAANPASRGGLITSTGLGIFAIGGGSDQHARRENPKNSRDRHHDHNRRGDMLAFVACWLAALGSPARRNNKARRRAGEAPVSEQRPKGRAGATYRDVMISGQCAVRGFRLSCAIVRDSFQRSDQRRRGIIGDQRYAPR
jgi:hypothetical protein